MTKKLGGVANTLTKIFKTKKFLRPKDSYASHGDARTSVIVARATGSTVSIDSNNATTSSDRDPGGMPLSASTALNPLVERNFITASAGTATAQ